MRRRIKKVTGLVSNALGYSAIIAAIYVTALAYMYSNAKHDREQ